MICALCYTDKGIIEAAEMRYFNAISYNEIKEILNFVTNFMSIMQETTAHKRTYISHIRRTGVFCTDDNGK